MDFEVSIYVCVCVFVCATAAVVREVPLGLQAYQLFEEKGPKGIEFQVRLDLVGMVYVGVS